MTCHFEHICPHCDYKSRTEGRLKRHIKDFHTDDPPDGFGSKRNMGRPKVFRCKQCDFVATEKASHYIVYYNSYCKGNKGRSLISFTEITMGTKGGHSRVLQKVQDSETCLKRHLYNKGKGRGTWVSGFMSVAE